MRKFFAVLLLMLAAVGTQAQTHSPVSDSASDVKAQALKLYRIIQKQDWERMFYLLQFSPKLQSDMKGASADIFAAGVRKGLKDSNGEEILNSLFSGMTDISVEDVTINGNKADVTTSSKALINGKTFAFNGVAHMIKLESVWKWDLTFSDDLEAATSQQTQALLGTPNLLP